MASILMAYTIMVYIVMAHVVMARYRYTVICGMPGDGVMVKQQFSARTTDDPKILGIAEARAINV